MVEKEDLTVQNGELFGRGRADLRNEQLKELIKEWEKQRDDLLDEIAFKRGQVEILEKLVKQSYERILEVNKEEQAKEQALIDKRFQDIRVVAEAEEEKIRAAEVLERHKQRQAEVKAGKKKGKPHPNDRARDVAKRKQTAKAKKTKE